MKSLIFAFLIVSFSAVSFADVYVRDDGGTSTECDGTVNAPKNSTKKCAVLAFGKNMTYSPTNNDNIIIGKGTYYVSARLPDLWVTSATFNKSPDFYMKAAKSGRRVFVSDLDGIPYELMLRKY